MPLCERLKHVISEPSSTRELLSLIGGIQRMDAVDHVAYLLDCRACGHNTIHRIDVPATEINFSPRPRPLSEFYGWVLRVHALREQRRLM